MITWENFQSFIDNLPAGKEKVVCEESRQIDIPEPWELIGSLFDNRFKLPTTEYFPWSKIAIGFFPYSGCDIYKDDQGRTVLTYVEFSGHSPFRRNFILSKNTAIVIEPISIAIEIKESVNESFLSFLQRFGIDKSTLEDQLSKFQEVRKINEELEPDKVYIYQRYFNEKERKFYYTIITNRKNALQITEAFNRK